MLRTAQSRSVVIIERFFDVLISAIVLVVLAPAFLALASAIWIEGGFPVIFSQFRVGKNGRLFRMHKFRKFKSDCHADGCGVSVEGDHRLTAVGAFLEKTKLNELPQLWNVLKGEMAIVGPRPESESFAARFSGRYADLLSFTPGIFGPNQYYFRNEAALYPRDVDPEQFYVEVLFPLKAQIDLAYFESRTLLGDMGWLVRGVLAVFGIRSMPDRNFEFKLSGWLDRGKSHEIGRQSAPLYKWPE